MARRFDELRKRLIVDPVTRRQVELAKEEIDRVQREYTYLLELEGVVHDFLDADFDSRAEGQAIVAMEDLVLKLSLNRDEADTDEEKPAVRIRRASHDDQVFLVINLVDGEEDRLLLEGQADADLGHFAAWLESLGVTVEYTEEVA